MIIPGPLSPSLTSFGTSIVVLKTVLSPVGQVPVAAMSAGHDVLGESPATA